MLIFLLFRGPCGRNLLDTQEAAEYTPRHKKEVLINSIARMIVYEREENDMIKKMWLSVVFVFIFAAHVFAAGFEPGVNVRAVEKDGTEIVGVIANYENAVPEVSCLDKSGSYFKLPLKDIKRITHVSGQAYMTGGGTKLPVLSFEMINGQTILGGLSSHGIVKIDMGYKGKRNLWLTDERYKVVEVVETGRADSNGQMKVRLINGQIIAVPVKKADVHSIIFE